MKQVILPSNMLDYIRKCGHDKFYSQKISKLIYTQILCFIKKWKRINWICCKFSCNEKLNYGVFFFLFFLNDFMWRNILLWDSSASHPIHTVSLTLLSPTFLPKEWHRPKLSHSIMKILLEEEGKVCFLSTGLAKLPKCKPKLLWSSSRLRCESWSQNAAGVSRAERLHSSKVAGVWLQPFLKVGAPWLPFTHPISSLNRINRLGLDFLFSSVHLDGYRN